jgi:hypothetical protein
MRSSQLGLLIKSITNLARDFISITATDEIAFFRYPASSGSATQARRRHGYGETRLRIKKKAQIREQDHHASPEEADAVIRDWC